MNKYEVYEASFDSGQGRHVLIVVDGIIKQQRLEARPGGNHSYTGEGNPEFIGMNIKQLRGRGFRKVRMSENQMNGFFESDPFFYEQ